MERSQVGSGAPWEAAFGYSRAVRVGNIIAVAGTTAADSDGRAIAPGDAYAQTRHILATIERSLRSLGAGLEDVVRTRMFVADMAQAEAIGRAHGEVFGAIRPAATMVQVAQLINPELLVEIEADAVLPAP